MRETRVLKNVLRARAPWCFDCIYARSVKIIFVFFFHGNRNFVCVVCRAPVVSARYGCLEDFWIDAAQVMPRTKLQRKVEVCNLYVMLFVLSAYVLHSFTWVLCGCGKVANEVVCKFNALCAEVERFK